MKQFTYNLSKKYVVQLNGNDINILVENKQFYARYPFYVEGISKTHVDIMMYLLLFGIEKIEIEHCSDFKLTGENTILSFSGGADSVGVYAKYKHIPIHIYRDYMPDYEIRQIKALDSLNEGLKVVSNFEQLRMIYGLPHGFNIGVGYYCISIPMLDFLEANGLSMGINWDDVCFQYSNPFSYNSDLSKSRMYNIKLELEKYGIKILLPFVGYSEVLITKIANNSGLTFSSCHYSKGKEGSKCMACYKCFRKEGILGRKITLTNYDFKPKLIKILQSKPLKMASSTIYGIQKAGYHGDLFDKFYDVDVSFCERIDKSANDLFFNGEKLPEYDWQTEEDKVNIDKFVKFINSL